MKKKLFRFLGLRCRPPSLRNTFVLEYINKAKNVAQKFPFSYIFSFCLNSCVILERESRRKFGNDITENTCWGSGQKQVSQQRTPKLLNTQ